MSKRRRASSLTGRAGPEEDESDSQPPSEPNRKKKKLDPMEMAQQLYDIIRNHKKEDGSLLCDSFIRAPKRRQEPAYYEVVQNPIDLLKVQQKLKTEEYEDMEELCADVELLVSNAKSFYKRNTQEYKDAVELWDLVQSTKAKILEETKVVEEEPKGKILLKMFQSRKSGSGSSSYDARRDDAEDTSESSSVTNDDEVTMCEELFNIIMTVTSDDGRPLHPAFQLLPSKKRYPNYYEVIEQPIDLRSIANKIQQNKYATLGEMEKDLLVLTKNACMFNEPGSQIYKDAKALRKLTQSKKVEIEQGKIPINKDRQTRGKRTRNSQSLVAITANLKSDDEDDDDVDDLCDGEEDMPSWQLFNTVKNCTNTQGELMSEPFYRLPSKRIYPDYYDEIRNPVSLTQICKKLQKGHYDTVSEVAGDLNIMFENAKKYNRPDSKLYKGAVKLQKIMQKRFQELLEVDNQYSESEDDSVDEVPRKQPLSSSQGGGSPMMSGKPPSKLLTRGKYLDNIPLKQGTNCKVETGTSTMPVVTPTPTTPSTSKVLTKGKYLDNIPLKKRIYCLCKTLMTFVCEDGRQPMLMFMEKPSAKLYPDYYEVIEQPIDMLSIQANIKTEKYQSEEEILADFKLMFRNCRKYNEIGSMIYEDATKLERILLDKVKELGPLPPNTSTKTSKPSTPNTPGGIKLKPGRPPGSTNYSPIKTQDNILSRKLRSLYHTVRDYRDPKGRQLSQIFVKLPSKAEYPDYYEVIKKPINLEQISQKAKSGVYESLDDLCADFILMFDNACKYNEPDSQIYKDALTLQRITLQTKLQLRQDESGVPDVPAAVQELLHSLFTSVYNHQDEEGRCFSDSMAELPEHDEVDGKKIRGLSLDLIKRRLDSGQYKRLDTFQEDMFACLLRARNLSRSDSQVFEDSVELQSYFVRQRDELCKNGDVFSSPALNFALLDLSAAVDQQRRSKQMDEQPVDDDNSVDIKLEIKEESGTGGTGMAGVADNALSYNQQVYRIGDFVYAEGNEKGMEPIILNIQRLWTNQEGQQMLYGNQYYRPNETYHVTTRKFLEKEVFKTDQNVAIPLNQVLGRCCILSVKDYFRYKPENLEDKDVYVCESRYSSRARAFKKIKSWPPSLMTGYKLVQREEPLEPKRVMSVFRQRVEKHMEELGELEEQEKLVEKPKPNVESKEKLVEGWTHYEQFNTPACLIKTGDCVYIKSDAGRQLVALIDTIWTNDAGSAFFRGPWVVSPSELPPSVVRNPFKQEVYLSTLEDTHSVNNILNKCYILEHSDYVSCRPTEIPERDVFLCENIYDEAKRVIRELGREGLKKYHHQSKEVVEDEVYYFKRIISLRAAAIKANTPTTATVSASTEVTGASPGLISAPAPTPPPSTPLSNHYDNSVDSDVIMEDSMDGPPPSVASDTSVISTPTTSVKKSSKPGTGKKLVTGYILYSGEVRKGITQSNPECNFGEVSRLVGNEWRKLAASEKAAWEEKAARMNEESQNEAASPSQPPPEHILVFECCWHDCDWQFEDVADAIEHACNDSSGHVYQFFAPIPPNEAEYQCHWRGCCRTTKKTIPPFPNLHRLARHVREVHLLKSTGRSLHPDHKSKHFLTSRKAAAAAMQAAALAAKNPPVQGLPNSSNQPGTNGNMIGANGRVFEPMFVTVPPRPQKLLHSEAYIKYIEGLTADNRSVSNWDKQLRASQANTEPVDKTRLPAHWLANGVGNHGNILNALWTLRDFMFKDALGISKHL